MQSTWPGTFRMLSSVRDTLVQKDAPEKHFSRPILFTPHQRSPYLCHTIESYDVNRWEAEDLFHLSNYLSSHLHCCIHHYSVHYFPITQETQRTAPSTSLGTQYIRSHLFVRLIIWLHSEPFWSHWMEQLWKYGFVSGARFFTFLRPWCITIIQLCALCLLPHWN